MTTKVDFVINQHPEVTRIAVLEDGRLMELIVEIADEKRIVGNIYLSRVNAVLPGMQARLRGHRSGEKRFPPCIRRPEGFLRFHGFARVWWKASP
jgi:hypothetical protein